MTRDLQLRREALERQARNLPCCRPGDSWRTPVEAKHTRTGDCLLRPMDGESAQAKAGNAMSIIHKTRALLTEPFILSGESTGREGRRATFEFKVSLGVVLLAALVVGAVLAVMTWL